MTAGIVVLCMPAVSAIVRRCHKPVCSHLTSYRKGFIAVSSGTKRHSDAETADSSRNSGNQYSPRQDYALQYMHRDHDRSLEEETRPDHDDLV